MRVAVRRNSRNNFADDRPLRRAAASAVRPLVRVEVVRVVRRQVYAGRVCWVTNLIESSCISRGQSSWPPSQNVRRF